MATMQPNNPNKLSLLSALLLPVLGVCAYATPVQNWEQSSAIPRSLDELWTGYAAFDKATPLAVEVLKAWEQEGVVCRLIRYQVGVFKGAPSKVAAFYAFPKGATKLPALLQLHGGGQSASLDSVVTDAKNGYASLSLNWGGNRLNFGRSQETYHGPQTDWGKLDATHPPQRNSRNHFAGALTPDEYTLDDVESPRNSNWFLVLIAARRAITFLEQQPEVDGARIGVYGHSMGGKLTTDLAGIDPRVKAAVPSCGGAGDILESQTEIPGCSKKNLPPMELACISDNAYIPHITCPVLWLSPVNDFHAHIDHMAWNWRNMPDDRLHFSMAPHLNHRHTGEHAITQHLWFEQNLKSAFIFPQTPRMEMALKTADGVPTLTLTPDTALPVKRVDIYYAIDPHELTRFWRDAQATQHGKIWSAKCPLMSLEQPLFAYANVFYDLPLQYRNVARAPGQESADLFAISSRVLSAAPLQLQAAGVKATDKPERMIDDGTRGWRDWYRLNWGHPPLWHAATRKLKDEKWHGPDHATLVFEIRCAAENSLVITFNCNEWGAFQPGKPAVDYAVVKQLKGSPDWQTVTVTLSELTATDPKVTTPLANWQSVAELNLCPSGKIVKGGKQETINGKPWQGPREIRNLRWEGGTYLPHQAAGEKLAPAEQQKYFNDAIRKSLEQERLSERAR